LNYTALLCLTLREYLLLSLNVILGRGISFLTRRIGCLLSFLYFI